MFAGSVSCKFNNSENKILPIKVRKIHINVGHWWVLGSAFAWLVIPHRTEIREQVMTERLSSLEVVFKLLSHRPERVKTC